MIEKRLLQAAVIVGSLVPIAAGLSGVWQGPRTGDLDLDSHFRYLSGLLLAIGLGYLSTVPRIESHGARFRLLTLLVVVGGLARLVSLLTVGRPSNLMIAALVMELAVTPALTVWQARVAVKAMR